MTRYIDTTECAKLVRKTLKEAYPTFKFSVRSDRYAGGSSINVHWVDGPTQSEVDALVRIYEGSTFDGQADMKNYHTSILDGEEVRFAVDYVSTSRTLTPELRAKAVEHFAVMEKNDPKAYYDMFTGYFNNDGPNEYQKARNFAEITAKGSVSATQFVLSQPAGHPHGASA